MAETVAIIRFEGAHEFLSNFFAYPLTYRGTRYRTAEHAYQAAKAPHATARRYIAEAPTPGEAKRRGRRVLLPADWEERKDAVMLDVLRVKFDAPLLAAWLAATRDAELIEGNRHHDVYWGRCECARHRFEGQNRLGRLLMQVRHELVQESLRDLNRPLRHPVG